MPKTNIAATVILGVMLILMLASVWNDSATMDELAHIPAGFGYVTQLDYRLNPEHPPLIKALAAFSSWIFARPVREPFSSGASPHFPTDTPYWRDDVNGQWAQGAAFLYESGNDADKIIFWSRLPLVLLTVFLGWLVFHWTKKRFGNSVALLTLTFFAFSPTILAHGRYVTTDLGAALGFFIGITGFIAFLERPTWRNAAIAGLLFGAGLLFKFSVVLLVPVFVILLAAWAGAKPYLHLHERMRLIFRLAGKTVVLGAIGLLCVWTVYTVFVWNYPQERQFRDARFLLSSYGFRPAADFDLALIQNRFTRPLGEYLLGFLMVQQRSAGGNTAFFLGEVSAAGSRSYFPILYLVKEPLALHILTLIALVLGIWKVTRRPKLSPAAGLSLGRIRLWVTNHFIEFSSLIFVAFYWVLSIKSPLNIGIRHVLPTLPFIYVLVSRQIVQWLRQHEISNPQNWIEWLRGVYAIYVKTAPRYLLVAVLFLWLAADTLLVSPHFMSYYNDLAPLVAGAVSTPDIRSGSPLTGRAGGPANGWKIAVDSNYDWGQDLKRLARFVEKNKIQKIAVDYFGGGSPRYYLGEKFEPWQSSRGPVHGWFAISATFRQGAFGTPTPGFIRKPEDSYEWLKPYAPVARIGYSIFLYKLP